MKYLIRLLSLLAITITPAVCFGQAGYQVVTVENGGTIKGNVKWLGAITPIGGLSFLAGWAWLFFSAGKNPAGK